MMIQPKGYEATLRRVDELKSRLKLLKTERQEPLPSPQNQPMQGSIPSNPNAPLDPFGQAQVTRAGASSDIRAMVTATAQRFGLDPVLFDSLVQAESDFNPKEVSNKGAIGLTQLMPGTAKSLGVADPFDPEQNLAGGAKYLSQLLRQFGDERLALAAYNAGPGAVKRYNGVPPYPETQNYVERIMTRVANQRGSR